MRRVRRDDLLVTTSVGLCLFSVAKCQMQSIRRRSQGPCECKQTSSLQRRGESVAHSALRSHMSDDALAPPLITIRRHCHGRPLLLLLLPLALPLPQVHLACRPTAPTCTSTPDNS